MTRSEWIRTAEERLISAGVDSPRLEAELLLAYVLQIRRMAITLHGSHRIPPAEVQHAEELLNRRCLREPSQYLIGTAAFLEHELVVNRCVLVPRPETEGLALRGIAELKERPGQSHQPKVLDFGTGSGALALSVAYAIPSAEVHALDISSEALEVARDNAMRMQIETRIQFHRSDGFKEIPDDLTFDLILANPPYIPADEIQQLPPEVRDFEPHLALDGGPDGLWFYRYLCENGPIRLVSGGTMMMELGDGQWSKVMDLFRDAGWTIESVEKDLSGKERILIVHWT